jgi:hypothetical protein
MGWRVSATAVKWCPNYHSGKQTYFGRFYVVEIYLLCSHIQVGDPDLYQAGSRSFGTDPNPKKNHGSLQSEFFFQARSQN